MSEIIPGGSFRMRRWKNSFLSRLAARMGFGPDARAHDLPPGMLLPDSSTPPIFGAPRARRSMSAGRKSFILVAAMIATAAGMYMGKSSPNADRSSPPGVEQSSDTEAEDVSNGKPGAQVSSLDVFMRTNSNTGLSVEDPSARAAAGEAEGQAREQPQQAQSGENTAPPVSALPAKGPLPASGGASKAAFSRTDADRQTRLLSQAGKLNSMQKSYGSSLASSRSAQDEAWGGSAGAAAGGAAALSGGVAGVLSVASVEEPALGAGPVVLEAAAQEDDSAPWKSMAVLAMSLLLLSAFFSAMDSSAMPDVAGHMLCGLSMALGLAALALGGIVAAKYGQGLLGGIYMIGGGVAVTAGLMALTRASLGPVSSLWMSAIAGIIGLLGAMFMSPAGGRAGISDSPAARHVRAPCPSAGFLALADYRNEAARREQAEL